MPPLSLPGRRGRSPVPPLSVHKDSRGIVYVDNVTVRDASSAEELMAAVEQARDRPPARRPLALARAALTPPQGNARRRASATRKNVSSSHTHSLVSLLVECTDVATGVSTAGKITFMDLAGSERVVSAGAAGEALRESQSIDQSLSALGDVIAALTSRQKHVPYRNHMVRLAFAVTNARAQC